MIGVVRENLSQWPFIIGAWATTAAVIGGYTASILRRGRRLSRQVPGERRRWM